MPLVETLLRRLGYVKLSSYVMVLTANGYVVPRSATLSWQARTGQEFPLPAPRDDALAAAFSATTPLGVPGLPARPDATPLTGGESPRVVATPVALPATPVATAPKHAAVVEEEDEEWEWRLAIARARAAAEEIEREEKTIPELTPFAVRFAGGSIPPPIPAKARRTSPHIVRRAQLSAR